MSIPPRRRIRMSGQLGHVCVLFATAMLLSGCSSSSGTRFTLFPEGHRLIDSAKEVRAANSQPWPLPRELDKHPLPPYVVEPGDVLLVTPSEAEVAIGDLTTPPERNSTSLIRFAADQPVLPDGSINLGRYGRLIVAGKTVDEIESLVHSTIQAHLKRDPGFINVRIVTRDSKVYYVLGEVNAPGAFQLKGREPSSMRFWLLVDSTIAPHEKISF